MMNNYYDIKKLSSTIAKQFLYCEHKALAMYNGEFNQEDTSALLIGKYVDSWVEGTLDEFKEKNPEIFNIKYIEKENTISTLRKLAPEYITRNDTIKQGCLTKARQEFPQAFIIEYSLKSDFKLAEEIIEKIKSNELFMGFLQGEKQKVVFGEIGNLPFKGKLDIYDGNRIVDLKIMRDTTRIQDKSVIEFWNYDLQLAIYQELIYQETGKKLPCYIAMATKTQPIELAILEINQQNLDLALERFLAIAPRVKQLLNGEVKPYHCNKCSHCKETKELKVIDSDLLGLSDQEISFINAYGN